MSAIAWSSVVRTTGGTSANTDPYNPTLTRRSRRARGNRQEGPSPRLLPPGGSTCQFSTAYHLTAVTLLLQRPVCRAAAGLACPEKRCYHTWLARQTLVRSRQPELSINEGRPCRCRRGWESPGPRLLPNPPQDPSARCIVCPDPSHACLAETTNLPSTIRFSRIIAEFSTLVTQASG